MRQYQISRATNFYTEGYKPYNNDRLVLYNKFCENVEKYCKLADVEQLEDIKLTTIPKNFLKTYTGAGDMTLTETEKAILIESVNNALKQPLQLTQSQYTHAPAK